MQGEGFEYHILAAGIAVAVMIRGGGAFSADGALADGSPRVEPKSVQG